MTLKYCRLCLQFCGFGIMIFREIPICEKKHPIQLHQLFSRNVILTIIKLITINYIYDAISVTNEGTEKELNNKHCNLVVLTAARLHAKAVWNVKFNYSRR